MQRRLVFASAIVAGLLVACGLGVVGSARVDRDDEDAGATSSSSSGFVPLPDGAQTDASSDGATTCVADLATDPANCGACAHDCQGGACIAGACQPTVFVMNEPGVTDVAVVGSNLVWTRPGAGLVRSMALAGGTPTTIISSEAGGPTSPRSVATDGVSLFFTDRNAGQVLKYDLDGGAVWKAGIFSSPTGIATDGTAVFFNIQDQDTILSVPMNGGDASTRMTSLNYAGGVAVHGGRIYASSSSGILVAPSDGGVPLTNISPTSRFQDSGPDLIHNDVTVDGTTAWFTIDSLGIVASVPTTGGVATVVAPPQSSPIGITVSPTTLYWANSGNGTIMKLAR